MSFDDEIKKEVERQKRDDEELQLTEMNLLYGSTQWTSSGDPHYSGFVNGWVAAMRWNNLRKPKP
jgi:hypothetical protein